MRVVRPAALLAMAAGVFVQVAAAQPKFTEVDLVSDVSGRAAFLDSHLANPWGIALGPTGIFWVADNHASVSTLYEAGGAPRPLVVTIPPSGAGSPTGTILNTIPDAFAITNGDTTAASVFIFVSEDGTISGWNPGVDATHAVVLRIVEGAIYKGVAEATTADGPRLYAANFHAGTIEVFDGAMASVTPSGGFTDPNLPDGYGPFNIRHLGGELFVAYAKQDANHEDEEAGAGFGFVDVFDLTGHLKRRLVSNGDLNAPWGMEIAPSGFGSLAGALMVGNFGDGRIHVYDRSSGAAMGVVTDSLGAPIAIEGLWGLQAGPPNGSAEVANRLYFAAGIAGEAHGLFGYLRPSIAAPGGGGGGGGECDHPRSLAFWRAQCGTNRGGHDGDDDGDDDHDGEHDDGGGFVHIGADSLDALMACAVGGSAAFGSGGCFTLDCSLLRKHHGLSARDRLAAEFAALLLNRCAGALCDQTTIRCTGEGDREDDGDDDNGGDDHHGDDDHDAAAPSRGGTSPAHGLEPFDQGPFTVGEVVAMIDTSLCDPHSDAFFRRLDRLATCANHDRGVPDEGRPLSTIKPGLTVLPLANPVHLGGGGLSLRFQLSDPSPTTAQVRIYDAAGRLVAEPARGVTVSGAFEVRWDGRNLQGSRVPAGTYFFRAVAGKERVTGRFIAIQ